FPYRTLTHNTQARRRTNQCEYQRSQCCAGHPQPPSLQTIENQLTTAEDTIRQQYRQEEQKRLLGVVQALRSLDQAIASLAGADAHIFEREKQPERTSVGRNTASYMLNRRDQEICQL